MKVGACILVVDPCSYTRDAFARGLKAKGFQTHVACSAVAGRHAAEVHRPDGVVVEQALVRKLGDRSGIGLVRDIKKAAEEEGWDGPACVVIAGVPSIDGAVRAFKAKSIDYIPKPCSLDQILLGLDGKRETECAIRCPSMDRMKYEYAEQALSLHDGNFTRTAKALGVSIPTLKRLLQQPVPSV